MPRNPEHPAKPLSLAHLTPEQAIRIALTTPKPGKAKKKRAKPKKS